MGLGTLMWPLKRYVPTVLTVVIFLLFNWENELSSLANNQACPHCPMLLSSSTHLSWHIKTHFHGQHICSVSDKPFHRAGDLDAHQAIHFGNRLVCPHCGNHKRSLRLHRKVLKPGHSSISTRMCLIGLPNFVICRPIPLETSCHFAFQVLKWRRSSICFQNEPLLRQKFTSAAKITLLRTLARRFSAKVIRRYLRAGYNFGSSGEITQISNVRFSIDCFSH